MQAQAPATQALPYGRVYNFAAGPATLPLDVLEKCQKDLLNWKVLLSLPLGEGPRPAVIQRDTECCIVWKCVARFFASRSRRAVCLNLLLLCDLGRRLYVC
jgi:hypothetical protein